MNNLKNIEAYLLAGGRSNRMGQDKGMMLFHGKPMIQFVIDEVEKLSLQIKIVANDEAYNTLGYEVFKDVVAEKGPMGGILTAIHHSQAENVLILSCDTPFLSSEIINHLISEVEEEDITVAQTKNRLHPLCAVYNTSLKKEIEKRIAGGQLKMQELIDDVRSKRVSMDKFLVNRAEAFVNLNTPEELEKYNHHEFSKD